MQMSTQLIIERNYHKLCFLKMEIPIFPLNGAVLFPTTSLPLNIFENRYLEMVNYSLGRDRLIGMIQNDENNKLFKIGCLGKIHSFNETSDGRYLISLHGTYRFKVVKEFNNSFNFRTIEAKILKESNKNYPLNDNHKKKILEKYKAYTKFKNINLGFEEIEKIEIEQIIKFIAMVSPFKDIEKQALLETNNFIDFYNKLLSIIELEIFDNFQSNVIN